MSYNPLSEFTEAQIRAELRRRTEDADPAPRGQVGQPNLSSGQWDLIECALRRVAGELIQSERNSTREAVWAEHEGRTDAVEGHRELALSAQDGANEYLAALSTIQTQRKLHEALRASVDRAKEARRNGN